MGNCWGVEVGLVSSDGNPNDSHTQNGNLCTSSRRVSYAVPTTPLRTEGEILQSTKGKRFTYTELKNATRNFRPDSVLGEGGFGSVFKGWIDEKSLTPTKPGTGMIIAVKRLKHESLQGHAEWLAEINYLEQFHHPHLVRLIGYCLEDEHRLLVYEFMSRGSLENHLFRRNSYFQPLSWNIRMKIALEAAKGLAYLHSPEVKIIYRDFKTSNVLLDSNYTAKISDFGLARDGPAGDQSHVSTRVMGTYGYAAPEYLATGHLTAKSDVYSFGVVLLELLSGRKTIDKNQPTRAHNLIEWAKPLLGNKRRFHQILDSRLEGQYSMSIAYNVASLAFECLSFEPKFRPSMDRVVTELEKLQNPREPTRRHRNERNVNNQVTNRTRDPSCPEARKRGMAHRGPLVRPFTPRDIQVEAH